MALLEHGLAVLALDQLHGNALAHTFGGTPDALLEAVDGCRARQAQSKVLLLVHLFIGVGRNAGHLRSAGLELIAGCARQGRTRDALELRVELGRATHAGGQVLGKVEDPFLFAVPAPRALGGLRIAALQIDRRRGLGVAKAHGCPIELHHHLAHLAYIALRAELAHPHGMGRRGRQAP